MSASVDYSDFTAAIKTVNRAGSRLQKDLVKNLHQGAPGLEAGIHSAAFTRIQHQAASTVRVNRTADGLGIHGGGGGLGGALFAGGEFGGRKGKKKAYSTRSPNGKAYVVRRRTTMMFLPHLGTEGYFLWPSVRRFLPKLYQQQKATVETLFGRH